MPWKVAGPVLQRGDAGGDGFGDEEVGQQADDDGDLVAQPGPEAAVEGVIAWLDAGRPEPETAADRITQLIGAAVTAVGG